MVIVIKRLSHRALFRPGRFDAKITVPMPDVKGRYDILKLHLKNVQVADGMFVLNVSGNGTRLPSCQCGGAWVERSGLKCRH